MSRLRKLVQENLKLAKSLGHNPRPITRPDPKGTLQPIRCETQGQLRQADVQRITGEK